MALKLFTIFHYLNTRGGQNYLKNLSKYKQLNVKFPIYVTVHLLICHNNI